MFNRFAVAAMVLALSPAVASATTTSTIGNQTHISYDNTDADVVLGDFNLALEPVGITALFPGATDVDGSLTFGVFSDPAAFGAIGSVDINIIADLGGAQTFSGSFDGTPLVFTNVNGDFVASFSTTFSDVSDVADLILDFSGFDSGDQFQVNVKGVSAIPLPASLPLLIGALGGLGFLSRRRRAAALVA